MKTLREVMEQNPNLSMRKIAQLADVSYVGLLKASHRPIQGQVYDPTAINFEAINQMIGSKLPEDFDWEAVLKDVEAPVQTPTEYAVGDMLRLRNPIGTKYNKDTIYKVVYLTTSHIILLPANSTEPRTLAINTMVQYGRPVSVEAEAVPPTNQPEPEPKVAPVETAPPINTVDPEVETDAQQSEPSKSKSKRASK